MAESVRNIGVEELKVLQLDILQTVADFCTERGIPYSLACGTLLGAVRHKGYIPWDDDIDIYVLREDYDRLLREFPPERGPVRIASLEHTPRWDKAYAKAYDARTVMVEHTRSRQRIGVGIDIFPLDPVPDSPEAWHRYDRRRRFWQTLLQMKLMRPDARRSKGRNLALCVVQVLLLPVPAHRLARYVDRLSRRFSGWRTDYVFECAMGLIMKDRFPRAVCTHFSDYPFEDRVFRGFSDYDTYLTSAYGDYRTLPPEEKRVSHHIFKAWWL